MNAAQKKFAFVARVDIDPEWRVVGQHPGSHAPVYEELRPHFRNVPDTDADGNQVWERHPLNNSPSYRRRKVEHEMKPFRFTLFDDSNGNVRKEEYVEPSAAELRERDLSRRKHDLLAGLVQGMAERDITPDMLLDRMFTDEAAAEGGELQVQYPLNYAPGRWRLSDQSVMQGTKEAAEAAEGALQATVGDF